MKKFTLEQIRKEFEEAGYEFLENENNGANGKYKVRCKNGHVIFKQLLVLRRAISKFKSDSKGCKYCQDDKCRLKLEDVVKVFESKGCNLLSTSYINNNQKLIYTCLEGHTHESTLGNFIRNVNSCPIKANNTRHTLEFIGAEFEKVGYTLLSTEYKRQKDKLKYRCKLGHIHFMTWSDFHNGGYRCPTCYYLKISGPGNYN